MYLTSSFQSPLTFPGSSKWCLDSYLGSQIPDPALWCSSQSQSRRVTSASGTLTEWVKRRKQSKEPGMVHKACNSIWINKQDVGKYIHYHPIYK